MKLCITTLDHENDICFDYNNDGYYFNNYYLKQAGVTWEIYLKRNPGYEHRHTRISAPQSVSKTY